MKVLIVDSQREWRETMGQRLSVEGYDVFMLAGMDALDGAIKRHEPDILVVGAGPMSEGMAWITQLRTAYPLLGIVVVGASSRQEDRFNALSLGADYYVAKPASMAEVSVTLIALSRRLRLHAPVKAQSRPWSFHPLRRQVHGPGGAVIALSEAEAALLGALVQAMPRPVSRDRLIQAVDAAGSYDTRRLDMLVYRLRRKLRCGDDELVIRSVYGVGYVCATEVGVVASL